MMLGGGVRDVLIFMYSEDGGNAHVPDLRRRRGAMRLF
jgi:hypothetical protein